MPASFSKFYLIGLKSESEFWGNLEHTRLFLLQGEGNRQWVEAHYPAGDLQKRVPGVLVPEKPEDPNLLLDSCMAFLPEVFQEIPDFSSLSKIVKGADRFDLNLEKPGEWDSLRKECLPYMARLEVKALEF